MDYSDISEIEFVNRGKLNIMLQCMRIFVRLKDDDTKLHEIEHKKRSMVIKETGNVHNYSPHNKYFYLESEYEVEKLNKVLKGTNDIKIGNVKAMRHYSEAELNANMSAANMKSSDLSTYKISANDENSRLINEILLD